MAFVVCVEFRQVFSHQFNVCLSYFEVLVIQKLIGDVESCAKVHVLLHAHFHSESADKG